MLIPILKWQMAYTYIVLFYLDLRPEELYSPIHTLMAAPLTNTGPNFKNQEPCGVQCLAQEHFHSWVRRDPNLKSSEQRSIALPLNYDDQD